MGTISFYSKDNCRGDHLGTLKDDLARDMNLTKERRWKNDEIRSFKFENVAPGTVLELWDSSSNRDSDDWIRVTFRERTSGRFDNIEKNPRIKGLTYERVGKGNLAGKVSRVVLKHGVTAKAFLAMDEVYTWDDKGGEAHTFEVSDSNYRCWRPSISEAGDGVTAVFKMDHIRSVVKDDHASVSLTFDGQGLLLQQSVNLQLAGKNPIRKVLEARNACAKELAAATKDPKAKATMLAVALGGAMQSALVDALEDMSEGGGRLLFPEVVNARVSAFATAVAKAL